MVKDVGELSEEEREEMLEKKRKELERQLEKERIRAEYKRKRKEMTDHVKAGGYKGKAKSALKSGLGKIGSFAKDKAVEAFDESKDRTPIRQERRTVRKPVREPARKSVKVSGRKEERSIFSGPQFSPVSMKQSKKKKSGGMKPAVFSLDSMKAGKKKKTEDPSFGIPKMDFSDLFGKKEEKK